MNTAARVAPERQVMSYLFAADTKDDGRHVMRTCSVEGCGGKHESLGLCGKHYQRLRKHGDPLKTKAVPDGMALIDRLTFYSERVGECLEWRGFIAPCGYGRLAYDNHQYYAHRIAYEEAYGPIPKGLHICHKCDNKICIESSHLFAGTHQDNMDDKVAKGRQARGEGNTKAKLTSTDVHRIRQLLAKGSTKRAMASEYSVTWENIHSIEKRNTWKHI